MRTDYDLIAERYDQDRRQRSYDPHHIIWDMVKRGKENVAVLDVGCGPGRWLGEQMVHFRRRKIRWVGVDPSSKMLRIAARNAMGAELIQGKAEALAFPDDSFDYVHSQVSFHHFEDKDKALDEIARVLVPGGYFGIWNIEIFQMGNWWPYVYFPGVRKFDEGWFWPVEHIAEGLKGRGLKVEYLVSTSKAEVSVTSMLAEAERRTLSQLASLDDAAYSCGMQRLRELAAKNPNHRHLSEFAWLRLTAVKAGSQAGLDI